MSTNETPDYFDEWDLLRVVMEAVAEERDRQRDLWGTYDNNSPQTWGLKLAAQAGKAADAAIHGWWESNEDRHRIAIRQNLARQVVQLVAAGIACLEQMEIDGGPHEEGEAIVAAMQARRRATAG